jgi:lysophospholipase
MSLLPGMEAAPLHEAVASAPAGGRAYWLRAEDGVRIRIAIWPGPAAAQGPTRGTVLLFPGRTEYIEKYGPAAADLAARGYAMLTVDWRGQGLADRVISDPLKGHIDSFDAYQRDVRVVVAAAQAQGLPEPYYLMAHSMGGTIGLRALHNGLPVEAAVFSAPMWGILLPPPVAAIAPLLAKVLSGIGLGTQYAPGTGPVTYVLKVPCADNMLTKDPEMWDFMVRQLGAVPALTLAGPTFGWLHAGLTECAALAALPAPDLPAFASLGTDERIIDPAPVRALMGRWTGGHLMLIDGGEHEVMMETPQRRASYYDAAALLYGARHEHDDPTAPMVPEAPSAE